MNRRDEDVWLAFVPRDTIFIRDGRAFDAGASTVARTVWPGPTTIAGATGAAFGAEVTEVRGPVLAAQDGEEWEPYFPAPFDLVVDATGTRSDVCRLAPTLVDGVTDLGDEVERWLTAPPEIRSPAPVSGWLPSGQLARYLAGELPGPNGEPLADIDLADPLHDEARVGLARSNRRVRPGYLYQATHLRPEPGWAFVAGCVLPEGWRRSVTGPVPLGGRGRLADVETIARVPWPSRPSAFPGGRVLVYLATPAIWPSGWCIPVPPGARLVAAATGEPQPAATTTPGPRWRERSFLRWAVPAGSVYLLGFADPVRAASWAAEVHGTAYGPAAKDELRTAGFGVVLTGVWT